LATVPLPHLLVKHETCFDKVVSHADGLHVAERPEKVAPLHAVGFVSPNGPLDALSALEGEILHRREYRALICSIDMVILVDAIY
jgi:hypothetical protein